MKKHLVLLMLTLAVTQAASAAQIVTVSRFQFGKQWAFAKEEVQLLCRADRSLYALNISTLVQYPLNEKAARQMESGQVKAQPIEAILLDDPANPGHKMSLDPFVARAERLCDAK